MLKIITLICALVGLLSAITLETWLRSRIVRNETSAEAYAEVKNRNSEFWSSQYVPLVIILALLAAVLFVFVGHLNAAVFLGGAALCFVSVVTGSATVVTGSISSSSSAASGDIRTALKTAYRSAAVMGLSVTSIALVGLGILFFFLKRDQLIDLVASFALGASVVSLSIGLTGTSFSGAYSLTVKSDDFTDYTGMLIGSGADHVESYILSACSAALLSGVAVETSGLMSTFTATTAARYPLIVLAGGIIASVIGVMTYRGYFVKKPSAGITVGNFIAAVIIAAVAVYYSNDLLQSYVYGICVSLGIIAALISGESSKLYSIDGPIFSRFIADVKKTGVSQSMIYSLSIGMISVIIPAVLTTAAMILSYQFASFYGIALAAVGINSMAAINAAVRGFSINTASASEIVSVSDPDAESPNPADVLLTASVGADSAGKAYSGVAAYVTLVAMYTALSVVANNPAINLLSTPVFTGITIGAVFVFVCAGLIIRSIRLTSQVLRARLNDSQDPEKRISALRGLTPIFLIALFIPIAAGVAGGVNSLIAFSCSVSVTGMCVIFAFNNAGRYFDRLATETLGTIIKLMLAVTLVFAPFFMEFGGLF